MNLIGRLQLATEKTREEDNEGITQLRILRTQVSCLVNYHKLMMQKTSTESSDWCFLKAIEYVTMYV